MTSKIFFILSFMSLALMAQNANNLQEQHQQIDSIAFRRQDYLISSNPATFARASEDCRTQLGPEANLVSIETIEEYRFIRDVVLKTCNCKGERFWTSGAYDTTNGVWRWRSRVPVGAWAPWGPGFPINRSSQRVIIYYMNLSTLTFETKGVTEESRYICEVPKRDIPIQI